MDKERREIRPVEAERVFMARQDGKYVKHTRDCRVGRKEWVVVGVKRAWLEAGESEETVVARPLGLSKAGGPRAVIWAERFR